MRCEIWVMGCAQNPELITQNYMKSNNTVLIVDAGGRGAALMHAYSKSPYVTKLIAVPGNDLMQINTKKPVKIYPHLKTTSVREIIEICKKERVDLVDVAQDNAVEAGLVDELKKNNILCIGPTRAAGQIEWDKAWARDFMKKYSIPHPTCKTFYSEKEGIAYIKKQPEGKWFVKANGLAEGKGVIPGENKEKTIEAVRAMNQFGEAGKTYLIEEWLEGEEFSYFVLCDGRTYQFVGAAQDHKRLLNFDEGPNTGGMGCSSPPLALTKALIKKVDTEIIKKTVQGLVKEGRPYTGILYLGGIIVKNKPYVIEFNARWGSPEAEVIVPSIQSDLFKISYAAIHQQLHTTKVKLDKKARVAVAVSLRPNPSGLERKNGREIFGIEEARKMKDVILYGARVKKSDKKYYVSSVRLLMVVGEGTNVIDAREKAYAAIEHLYIENNNAHYRTDIGWRDVERLRKR